MKRSELPDEVFGIPQERKYPMPDKKHTESAIKLFNHVDPKYEEQLAKKVIANMKKYNIVSEMVGKNNRLRKYLPKDMVSEAVGTRQLYFISEKKGLTHLNPRVPSNYMTKNGYEDGKTPRVCFSTSIDGCLMALSMKCSNHEYYVYTPTEYGKIISPTVKQVPDVKITNEKWILEPVDIQCIGKILCIGDAGEDGIPYKYGNNTAELYKWNWKWVEKYSVNEAANIDGVKNVVFDLGSVLVDCTFEKRLYSDSSIPDQYAAEIMKAWIIDNDYTEQCTEDEYIHLICQRLRPELHKYIPDILRLTIDATTPYPETRDVINLLKEKGYGIYYLSNWNSWTAERFKQNGTFSFLDDTDGGLFSYECGLMKPDHKIYETFLKKFGLDPSTCVFLDDREENVKAARECGMKSEVFTGDKLPEILEDLGSSIFEDTYEYSLFVPGYSMIEWTEKVPKYLPGRDFNLNEMGVGTLVEESKEDPVDEYGAACMGTVVGTGNTGNPIPEDTDNVYIVNYMTKNTFSGEEEARLGICKTGMKDLHIKGGKYNRIHKADVDKFKENAYNVKTYRYIGPRKNSFYEIVEDSDSDKDFYTLLTGTELQDVNDAIFGSDFVEETAFFDELDAIKAVTEATALSTVGSKYKDIPVLTENVVGRSYNYYRDINGVYAINELTFLRTKSYPTKDDIPSAQLEMVKFGVTYQPE